MHDQQGNTTSISYDTLGRKTQMSDPDMGTWQYQYDPNGNLTQQLDAKSQTIYFSYDLLDRLIQKTYSTGDATAYYHYDEAGVPNGKGQRTSMSRATANTAWQYDTRGRTSQALYQVISGGSYYSYQYTYDSADRLTTLTYPSGEALTYAYDAGWRQTSVRSGSYGCYATAASYTALDQPSSITLGSGVVQTYNYSDPMARLSNLMVGTPGGGYGNLFNRSYQYDNAGNVYSIVNNQNAEQQTYAYDPLDRLTTWSINGTPTEQYVYDAIGNLTIKAGTAYIYGATNNGPHQARTVSGKTYSYDSNGNLTSGGNRNYTWNAENQPSSISYNAGSGNDSYAYDADGERVSRTSGGLMPTTTYYIGGLYELDSDGSTRLLYQFGGQTVAQRSGKPSGASKLYYLHGDHLGSVSLTTDASGNLVSSQEFKPWGEVRSGGVGETKLNYTGQKKDDTGLLYYNARYYDPVLGRFISADSIVPQAPSDLTMDLHETGIVTSINQKNADVIQKGFGFQTGKGENTSGPPNPQNLNRYSYVNDKPLTYTDPTGHSDQSKRGGTVYNKARRNRPVWVYGTIPYDQFLINCKLGRYSCDLPANNNASESDPYNRHRVDINGNPDPNGAYVQGWFLLPGGENSFDYLGMTDADFVRAVSKDDPLYESTITCAVYFSIYGMFCGRVQGDAHGPGELYKLGDNQTVTITDDLGYLNLSVSGFEWVAPFHDNPGWKTCIPADPLPPCYRAGQKDSYKDR